MLILSVSWLVEAKAEEKPVGKILGVIGQIEYRSAVDTPVADKGKPGETKLASFSPWKKAVFKQPVYAKDEFKTAKRSRLKIIFSDKSLIAIGPNSKMQVASYVFNKKKKLRKGVINVARGLTMYIVNKSQKNKNSKFRIVSPTANLAARGTQGYVSSSDKVTYIANQTGAMETSNSDPTVAGSELVGAMKKNSVSKGQPPTAAKNLTNNELTAVRSVVMGPSGINPNNKFIKDKTQTNTTKKKKSKKTKKSKSGGKKKGGDKEGESSEESDSSEGGDSGDSSSEGGDSSDSGGDSNSDSSSSSDSGGSSGGDSGGGDGGSFADSFSAAGSSGGDSGGGGDFSPVNNSFSVSTVDSCSG